ncbi:MAG: hypothetical protein GYB36_09255 [Alphaproteobacteria bacterium]|nr:hypothetical protein [Alphaproteobacteria bacterium]
MAVETFSNAPAPHLASRAVRDWLETQAHVLAYWREVLISTNESDGLIEVLDDHARFLQQAARVGEGHFPSCQ